MPLWKLFLTETGNYRPSTDQISQLCSKIRATPGGEFYDSTRVKRWFASKRTRLALTSSVPQRESRDIASGPTDRALTSEATTYLTILVKGQGLHPPPSVIDTWATLLHVSREAIVSWLAQQESQNYSTVTHLPTPVSTSPEPASEYQDGKIDPWYTPVVPDKPLRFCTNDHWGLLDSELIKVIAEVSKTRAIPTLSPTSAEEFEQAFAPYQHQMELILQENVL